jgi:DNA/RNA endonuclease G (NUC1)
MSCEPRNAICVEADRFRMTNLSPTGAKHVNPTGWKLLPSYCFTLITNVNWKMKPVLVNKKNVPLESQV